MSDKIKGDRVKCTKYDESVTEGTILEVDKGFAFVHQDDGEKCWWSL